MIAGYEIDVREFVKDKRSPDGMRMINRFMEKSQQPFHGAGSEEREIDGKKTTVFVVKRVLRKIYGPSIPEFILLSPNEDVLEERYQRTFDLHVTTKVRRRIRDAYAQRSRELRTRGSVDKALKGLRESV